MAPRPDPSHRGARHRKVRPRRGRIAISAVAASVTLIALLGGFGLLPGGHQAPASASTTVAPPAGQGGLAAPAAGAEQGAARVPAVEATAITDDKALPADSGSGKRIVFAMDRQRVWLVGADGSIASTYLVSGSVTHNLHAGSYRVYSRSRWAVGVDDSGTMQYFVRFAHGRHAAIGFHSIPTKHGRMLQTRAQLGTPRSHGCIRQWLPDAIRLWHFAPVGTHVVVKA